MGQCYSVLLKVKFTNEQLAAKALMDKISRGENERVSYNIEKFQENGVDTNSALSLLRVFYVDRGPTCYRQCDPDDDGFTLITSDFDCCYGWHNVMSEAFEEISPYLADGSFLEIWPDSGHERMDIVNGSVNDEWFDDEDDEDEEFFD